MCKYLWTFCGLLLVSSVQAQPLDPFNTYDRAYRHFLSSPSRLKTFSHYRPGYTVEDPGPFDYRRFTRDSGYENHRIDRFGYERYQTVPGYTIEESSPFGYRIERVPTGESFEFRPHLRPYVPGPRYFPPPYRR